MKRLIIVNFLSIILMMACTTNGQTPTPQKLSQDIQSLPSNTIISVISLETYAAPKGAEIIEKAGLYETVDNIYDARGYNVVIPRNALVRGIYTNDGKQCTVTWKAIYLDKQHYNKNMGSFEVGKQSVPTICDPIRGVFKGQRLLLHLNRALAEPL
ncbi:MAG: hypothetical protein ACK5Z5_00080 [Neisseriaceae bacterium]